MTQATLFDTGFAPAAPTEGWLARVRKALADRALYNRTLSELRGLTNHDLTDLGISRHDLERIARESVYGA